MCLGGICTNVPTNGHAPGTPAAYVSDAMSPIAWRANGGNAATAVAHAVSKADMYVHNYRGLVKVPKLKVVPLSMWFTMMYFLAQMHIFELRRHFLA